MMRKSRATQSESRNKTGIICLKMLNSSRKEYNLSKQEINFNYSCNFHHERNHSRYQPPGKVSRTRIFNCFYYKNNSADLGTNSRIAKDSEKFFDNESLTISSLLSVPKVSHVSNPFNLQVRRAKNATASCDKPRPRPKFTRKSSIECSTVRYSILSDDNESPSPIIQPRYKY